MVGGLDDRKSYTVKIGGSRAGGGQSRITDYTIGATTLSLECRDNTNNDVTFTSVSPTGGLITITATNTNNQFGYCGWIEVNEE